MVCELNALISWISDQKGWILIRPFFIQINGMLPISLQLVIIPGYFHVDILL